ncbi:MAG TPA: hypothetical protein VF552_11720 [Allosphingosinicella sp.]|jgi:hypothetical protein
MEPDEDKQIAPPDRHAGAAVWVEVASLSEALAEAARLIAALAPDVAVRTCRAERYWKIEEWFKIDLDFEAADAGGAFAAALAKLAPRWGRVACDEGDLHASWHHLEDGGFILPSARCAILQAYWPVEPD